MITLLKIFIAVVGCLLVLHAGIGAERVDNMGDEHKFYNEAIVHWRLMGGLAIIIINTVSW